MTDFDQFFALYPRKSARKDAEKAWNKLSPSPPLVEQMLVALTWQRVSAQWLRDGGQFVPYAATWLRGERWKDQVPQQTMHEPDRPCPRCGGTPKCQSYKACTDRIMARAKAAS